jgi:formylglycine-generating enzyme required for sulfatase activity
MSDPSQLADAIAAVLSTALPSLQEKAVPPEPVSAAMGADAGLARRIWEVLEPVLRTKPSAKEAAEDLARTPEDLDVRSAFRLQVRKALAADPELAARLERLIGDGFPTVRSAAPPLARYDARVEGSGASAQDGGTAAGESGLAIGGNVQGPVTMIGKGATVVVGEMPVTMTAVDRASALGRYLEHVIARNRYLQLQGIRSGGRLVNIELDRIYIRLRATQQRVVEDEERWLTYEAALAPGERGRPGQARGPGVETVTVSVDEALASHPRLVILGDPGSGKTTLARYLALLYARDLAQGNRQAQERLGSAEPARLPILLALRQVGAFLRSRNDDGTEGHALLLDFLRRSLANERIELPPDFFDEWLKSGRALILLDGLDEVADPDLRNRASRLVERFTATYPDCRYMVTSRIVGYAGAARLGEQYAVTTVRDFTLDDVERFLTHWHLLVAIGQMGPGDSAEAYAAEQTRQLRDTIRGSERIRDLAINPLMLTVIALVHRDRVKLPDRRAELYAEAIDVLLGKWEEAKGVHEVPILPGRVFDTGDKRLMLQSLALRMHEQQRKEIELAALRELLKEKFAPMEDEPAEGERAAQRFLDMMEERTGLLVARGEGVYTFSHLTFQEYLAARAAAGRDDYVAYTLSRASEPWWREVILLEAGFLSTESKERTTRLIRAIAERKDEPEPYHNLVLAAECLRDVGASRVEGNLEQEVQRRLRKDVEALPTVLDRWRGRGGTRTWFERRAKSMQALVRAGAGFWTRPYGEPEWVEIPAGEFWMGSERGSTDEQPVHKVSLDRFLIARVPITNAQYHLFMQATGHIPPGHWEGDWPPKGLEAHPVANVSWHDAQDYCAWLSKAIGKSVTLPSEAEWEKAARGDQDPREYPWGDTFEATRCNNSELGLGSTTPVGIFPEGASPYGCLDMAGNVWEWTRSLWGTYPDPAKGPERTAREDLSASGRRVLRGGAFYLNPRFVRCAARLHNSPDYRRSGIGFRVVVSPFFSGR